MLPSISLNECAGFFFFFLLCSFLNHFWQTHAHAHTHTPISKDFCSFYRFSWLRLLLNCFCWCFCSCACLCTPPTCVKLYRGGVHCVCVCVFECLWIESVFLFLFCTSENCNSNCGISHGIQFGNRVNWRLGKEIKWLSLILSGML